MRIAALTCRSFYSLLRGSVSVSRWVQKAAEKTDVRPIIGVEILTDRQRAILLAENRRGYGNLCRITTARNLAAGFDLAEQLQVDHRGVLCICSEPKRVEELKVLFPRGDLWAGCRDSKEAQSALARGVEPIPWTRVNWLENEDIEVAQLLARIRQRSVAGSGPDDDGGFDTLMPMNEFVQRFRSCRQALANADELVERCCFQLLSGRPILPKIRCEKGMTGDRELAWIPTSTL